jgi:hypothetical protein
MTKHWTEAVKFRHVAGAVAMAFGMAAASPILAQAPSLQMLDKIDPGMWEVRVRDAAHSVRRLCLETGRPLIQIKHPNALCRSFVVQDESRFVTVHYTCPGAGYGRTQIRLENARLAQIESQRIAEGFPFDFTAEARRVGVCHD